MVDLAKKIKLPDLEIYCKNAIEDVMHNCDPTDGTGFNRLGRYRLSIVDIGSRAPERVKLRLVWKRD